MKKIFLVAVLMFSLWGGAVNAVSFDDAMTGALDGSGDQHELDGLFPSWPTNVQDIHNCTPEGCEMVPIDLILPEVKGVIGKNRDIDATGKTGDKLLMNYIPHLIDILLKFVAPVIMIAMIFAGLRFVYAGSDEEETTKAKQVFTYTLMGALFVILSYSIMKAVYFLLTK